MQWNILPEVGIEKDPLDIHKICLSMPTNHATYLMLARNAPEHFTVTYDGENTRISVNIPSLNILGEGGKRMGIASGQPIPEEISSAALGEVAALWNHCHRPHETVPRADAVVKTSSAPYSKGR